MKTKIFTVVTVFLIWILNLLLFKEESDEMFTYFMSAGVLQSILYKDRRLSYVTGVVALSLMLIVNKSSLWLWFLDFFTFTDHSPIWQIFISVSLIATILTVIYGRKLQTTLFNKIIGLLVCIILPLIGCVLVYIRYKFPDDEF
ncbi:MAG: hypothetical protein LBS55_06885 [Prevotellaceae bacterium]|jgi:hypothetical protein|nr:hypothetical protein [Prevotellaceae bacterium]